MEAVAPPPGEPLHPPFAGTAIDIAAPDRDAYLDLYRAIGEPLQWDLRLRMSPSDLDTLLARPSTVVHVLRVDGLPVGMCEFNGVGGPDVELVHFGLVATAQGRRLGPFLLDRALRAAWSRDPRRIWLHTDTNDHPKAQATYSRAGFTVFDRRFETFPD